ncbi:MAG: MFS transporter, partial [Bacillota bacterium]
YLIPVLPLYLHHLGKNSAAIGLIIGSFSFTAILLRPQVGRLSDFVTKRSLMLWGTIIFILVPPLYLCTKSTLLLTFIRLFHGAGLALFAAASAALVPDIVPATRLGEATGVYVTSVSIASGLAPLLGNYMVLHTSYATQLLLPCIFSVLAALLVFKIKESPPLDNKSPISLWQAGQNVHVIVPSLTFATCTFSLGTITAFLPLFLKEHGIDNSGIFFIFYSMTLISMRFLAGRLSDRWKRTLIIIPSLFLLAVGLGMLALTSSIYQLALSAVLFGMGYALVYPNLNAWVVEHVPAPTRGASLGIFSASTDLGAFLGPLFMGLLVDQLGYQQTYLLATTIPLTGLLIFWFTLGQVDK